MQGESSDLSSLLKIIGNVAVGNYSDDIMADPETLNRLAGPRLDAACVAAFERLHTDV